MTKLLVALTIAALVAGCAIKPAPMYRAQETSLESGLPRVDRERLLSEMGRYQGVRYREGGIGLSGIDCSGLVQVVFEAFGMRLPRTVTGQYGQGTPLSRSEVGTGDLVFFGRGNLPSHVGIAVSDSKMLHASSSRGVVIEDIDSFARSLRLTGIRRIVRLK